MLKAENVPFSYALTQAPGHAAELAKEAVEKGFTSCIGVGSDGTLPRCCRISWYANGVGCIPTGAGNDFARIKFQEMRLNSASLRGIWSSDRCAYLNDTLPKCRRH